MTLCKFVDTFIKVEYHGNYHDDGNQKDVGTQKLVNDVAVQASDDGLPPTGSPLCRCRLVHTIRFRSLSGTVGCSICLPVR